MKPKEKQQKFAAVIQDKRQRAYAIHHSNAYAFSSLKDMEIEDDSAPIEVEQKEEFPALPSTSIQNPLQNIYKTSIPDK